MANPICQQCDAQVRHPLLPWLVGEKFADSTERIVFVGKPHRGEPGQILPSGIMDPTPYTDTLWGKSWPYWRYTRDIAQNLYGENAADFIALTNLIKCTNVDGESTSTDRTSYEMADRCVLRLGLIWREIELLEARTVVFYTYSLFRNVLEPVPVARKGTVQEVHPQDHYQTCRNKRLWWWERACRTAWTENLRILVVGHPERQARIEYVKLLTTWLRPNSSAV